MSNIVMEQHVKRRVKKRSPARPLGFRGTGKDGGWNKRPAAGSFTPALNRLPGTSPRTEFIQGIKQRPARLSRAPVKRAVKKNAREQEKTGRKKVKASRPFAFPRSPLVFLFGPQGLFSLPNLRPLSGIPADIASLHKAAADRSPLRKARAGKAAAGAAVRAIRAVMPDRAPATARPGFPLSPLIAAAFALVISLAALNWRIPATAPLLEAGRNYPDLAVQDGNPEWAGELERNLASYAGIQPQAAPAAESEAIPQDLAEIFAWKEYRVRRGDTLSQIAQARKLSLGTLIASNGITNARRLRDGEILRIPNMDGIPYTVRSGDSLSGISAASSVPLRVIVDVNNLESDVIKPGTSLFLPGATMPQEELRLALGESFMYPVRGILSSPYGWRVDPIAKVDRFHSAIDLAAPQGTPVRATFDGKVSRVATNSVYGNYIILTHQGGYQSLYAHLSATSVRQGATVSRGSKIGEVGSTGYSTGPHLHFSVFKDNKAINPLEVLQR